MSQEQHSAFTPPPPGASCFLGSPNHPGGHRAHPHDHGRIRRRSTTDAHRDEAEPTEPETATLPDLVGQDLQAAGFYLLDDQDAGGQNRLQIMDRNWTVCSQEPAPGTHPTDALVTLNAVKDDETC